MAYPTVLATQIDQVTIYRPVSYHDDVFGKWAQELSELTYRDDIGILLEGVRYAIMLTPKK